MPVLILYGVFAVTSFFSGLALLTLFTLYRELRKGPGQLILGQCLAQILLDGHWLTYFFCWEGTLCQVAGGISFFAYSLAFSYAVMVCWVVSKHFYEPYIPQNYNNLYHCVCITSASIIAVLTGLFGHYGPSMMGTCFTKQGKNGE